MTTMLRLRSERRSCAASVAPLKPPPIIAMVAGDECFSSNCFTGMPSRPLRKEAEKKAGCSRNFWNSRRPGVEHLLERVDQVELEAVQVSLFLSCLGNGFIETRRIVLQVAVECPSMPPGQPGDGVSAKFPESVHAVLD